MSAVPQGDTALHNSSALHPLSAFLAPWLTGDTPDLARLNAMACEQGLITGGGVALRFVESCGGADGYEERAFLAGEIATRPGNWHDLFNALIWLALPLSKAALNRRHFAALTDARRQGRAERGALRDALTQFDECGVVVAGPSPDLWQGLCAHRWREVFVDRRAELLRSTRFLVFGHASHDALAAPFVGLCGKALFIDARDPDEFAAGHIPGAMNISADALMTGLEPVVAGLDKTQAMILYCGNLACSKSKDLAQGMKDLGFANLAVMPEGLDGWRAVGGPVEAK